jgi:hypothetical protein
VLDWPEIVLRLGVATLAGSLIGLDRDLRGKPIGLKTLGLVGLATAMVVMLALPAGDVSKVSDAASRVIQGVLTGIGFLGAGVIVRGERGFSGSRAHQRGLRLAHRLCRHRLRSRAMAHRDRGHRDRNAASAAGPSAGTLAAPHAGRHGRIDAKFFCCCAAGCTAALTMIRHRPQTFVAVPRRLPHSCHVKSSAIVSQHFL